MFRSHKTPTLEEANFNHLVIDIVWFGLALAATSRFLSLYAIRLGATAVELSWLAALPGVVLLLSTGLSGWWRRRYSGAVQAIRWPSLMFRLVFLLPALAPVFPAKWQPLWLILAVSLPALPQGISGAIFLVVMRESVSQSRIATLLSRRSLALNVTVGIGAVAFGILLEKLPFPLNYQVMFVLAFIFALCSQWHVVSVRTLHPESALPDEHLSGSPWHSRAFLAVAFVAFIAHAAFFSIITTTPLRLVEDLGAAEGFMALFALAELTAGAIIATFTDRIIRHISTRGMTAIALVGTALAAMIIGSATRLEITLLAGAISGASWTAAGIGIFASLYERMADQNSTRMSTAFQQVIALGVFVGPLIGGNLAGYMTLVNVILIGAALRLVAGILTYYNLFELAFPANFGHQHRSWHPLRALNRRSGRG